MDTIPLRRCKESRLKYTTATCGSYYTYCRDTEALEMSKFSEEATYM